MEHSDEKQAGERYILHPRSPIVSLGRETGTQLDPKNRPIAKNACILSAYRLREDTPRLPLIGLRTIIVNKLRLAIDGDRRQVTLKTKGWF